MPTPTFTFVHVLLSLVGVFVGVVQAFLRVPALTALASTQTEPPFVITQLVVLALFIVLTIVAEKRFHSEPVRTA
jgi:hypothetical protein